MKHFALVTALLAVAACKKEQAPTPSAKDPAPAAPTPTPTPTPVAPAPVAPPPEPVALTADQLRPTCEKIVTAELAAKTHGATEVKSSHGSQPTMTTCALFKDGEQIGSITIACKPDLDTGLIQNERAAMSKATDLTPSIGRGGYRLSNMFTFNDDETPCRIQVMYVNLPADDVWPDALRAIVAAVNPTTLK